ncbi:SCO family protein [Burkholderia sp. Ac-20345]|uniref:SCO family protein n=1 Tax=Burkholderia sp. Ac-20345 TaxID=2703891 RepID=UPI00197C13AF|nr:SCO family protein [Burkholderia sp. Ac-20345]MBN3782151.1 SCO family protein [Burkholderia sp. Ac-20345]
MNANISCNFDLIDHHGKLVTFENFRGHYLLVYFGFTHCRVVCPRSLTKLSTVLDRLESKNHALIPLYITVDPTRDTPAVMKAYLTTKYPRFTGLTGAELQIENAKKAFRVFAQKKLDAEDADGYVVPHTAIAYLIGPDGAYISHFVDSLTEDEIVERMSTLLSEDSLN